eukprot:TRINITY_DN700_c0_g1_i1.p1 TRINITY_DN700_c0_g1~~TRINITY_DN700_c0_g1_i1.p1  ORF type:complete len:675 (+),score=324.36 TRINITY_DN700_c0_g1_i1:113-2137(+)
MADLKEKLSKIGLDAANAENVAKNQELTQSIVDLLDALKVTECEKGVGSMLYLTAVKVPAEHRELLGGYIMEGKVNSKQCDAAVKYLSALKKPLDKDDFIKQCGIGITVSPEEIAKAVATMIKEKEDEIKTQRYKFNQGKMLGDIRKTEAMKWADGELAKVEIEQQIAALLGPMTEEDTAALSKKPKEKKEPKPAEKKEKPAPTNYSSEDRDALLQGAMGYKAVLLKDIADHEGKTVTIRGWAHTVRQQSGLCFVVLRDGTGFMQVVIKSKTLPDPLHKETTLVLKGLIKAEKNAAANEGCPPFEMQVEEWAIVGESSGEATTLLGTDNVHQLLENRHMALRRTKTAMVMRVRSHAMKAFRDHFYEKGCMEVQPPTMVQTQCEGGSTLFKLDFYGEEAYMTQSSQLYLETALPMIGDCFCILPSYRAEKSLTKRHLSEFTHVEAEYPFITFDDLLERLEDLVVGVLTKLMNVCGEEIRTLNPIPMKDWTDDGTDSWKQCYIPKRPFKRITHADAIEICRKHNIYKDPETKEHFGPDDDIPDAPERAMVATIGEPVFMTHFPTVMKSFYMKKVEGRPDLTESVDLLMPGVGEIIGGSMRIHDYEELMAAYKREELDPAPYYWFTDQRKYGTTPHGGFGLGLERFLVWLCNDQTKDNVDHVREVCLFPRLYGRCTP